MKLIRLKININFVLLFCSLFALRLFALDPNKRITQYDIKVYTAKDGLPMNSLKKVFQDSRGNIWIGTQEGLVRFDGVEFKIYDKSQYPGLKCNFIFDMDEDADGNLWLATAGGGICCFDGFSFTTYDTSDGLVHNIVNKIIVCKDSTIWAGTENGLSSFKNHQFTNYTVTNGLCGNNIQALFEAQKGHLIIGSYSSGYSIFKNNSIITFARGEATLSIDERKSGEIVLGATWGKIYCFQDIRIHHPDTSLSLHYQARYGIRSVLEDRNGNLWFCTEGSGIFRYCAGKLDSLTAEKGLQGNNNYILSALEGQEGSLWFAGDAGLIQLKDNKFHSYDWTDGRRSNYGHTVCEDQSGNIYVGFKDAGLSIINQSGLTSYRDNNDILPKEITSIIPAYDGGLWIGASRYGLYHLFRNGEIKELGKQGFVRYPFIYSLFETKNNELWIGCSGYVNKFINDKFTYYCFNPNFNSRSDVTAIIQTQNGDIWFGTRGEGLFKIVENKITQQGIALELITDGITALYEDMEGSLWIGSDNHGLYRYKNDIYSNYSVRDGLLCDRLFSILEDDSSKLWFSTNKGVFSVKKQQFNDYSEQKISRITYQAYNHLDGMREAECNGRRQPSAWKSRDRKLWFTSIAGVVSIDPNNIPINRVKPPVYIENIISKDSLYRYQSTPIHLTAKERDIEFHYTALSYAVPERVNFKYQLVGYDKEWIDAETRRSAYYTNIPKGNYTFQVIACNNDGFWNKEGASIQLSIPPFWWETRLAIILYFMIGLSLLIWIFRRRYKRKFVEAQLKLQREHAAKLEELDKAKSRFFAGISHEFRTPLTLIEGPLKDLRSEIRSAQQRSLVDMMLRNTQRLRHLVNQLLDLSRLQSEKMKLQARPVQLIPFLKGIVAAFESYAKRENIMLRCVLECDRHLPGDGHIQDHIQVYLDPEKMEKVFINLLSNAIKFTPTGGKVELIVEAPDPLSDNLNNETVKVHITDTGVGIPENALPHIFGYFYRYRDETNIKESGAGIGLALTRELVHLHHGEISVVSKQGEGSKFTVILPLGNNHLKPDEIASKAYYPQELDHAPIEEAFSFTNIEQPEKISAEKRSKIAEEPEVPTILLVEDNPDMRKYITDFLEAEYEIIEARNGKAGLEMALAQIPDLIISDIMMPEMDGLELCEKLKNFELTSHIPIILLTAKGSGENKIKGLELGAVEYIIKPFDRQELLLKISNLIELQRKVQDQIRKEISVVDSDLSTIPITSADDRFIKKAEEITQKYVTDPKFNAQILSREIGLSRAHLNRKLKGLLGQRTNEFIRSIRLKQAAVLLQQKFGSVSEIAYEVGFNHLSYFAQSFKKQYGVAPSEYPV